MSLRKLSPTANLLRSSRLFALPSQLERPSIDLSATASFDSDTSTTHYPTHAAIQTTESSLARGDWGLKRPLPLKSTTRTSTPTVRIENIDSIDHVTDFASAADHVITLQKWQEMGIPLIAERKQRARATMTESQYEPSPREPRPREPSPTEPERSVFDSQYDNTQIKNGTSSGPLTKERWKYRGPWIAGKSEGEFQQYVEKTLRKQKVEFRHFIRQKVMLIKQAEQRRHATEQGEDFEDIEAVSISAKEVNIYIKRLRNDENAMHRLIEEYLDLPRDETQAAGTLESDYDSKGPPTTHPSAGLSYLRTKAVMWNHPEYGPQEHNAPIQGRVIAPQRFKGSYPTQALFGVGGVVALDKRKPWTTAEGDPSIASYDPDIPGGARVWVHPSTAVINSRGQTELVVDRANPNEINVATGAFSGSATSKLLESPPVVIAPARDHRGRGFTELRQSRSEQNYGLEYLTANKGAGRAQPLLSPGGGAPDMNELLRKNIGLKAL
ncbi:hypothetical protein MMC21_005039 [Puttea exsequens]|nr:hypothetical protein [Puttea exsequens]